MAAAQPWARFYNPHVYAISSTGAPSPGAKAYFYASGTTLALTTYAEDTLSVPNQNPVVADANGKFPDVFLQNLAYRVVITDANGVQIDYADPVSPFIQSATELENSFCFEFTCDGNGNPIPAGKQGDQYCPIDCGVTAAIAMADKAGNIVVDVFVAPFVVNTPPTSINSIVNGDPIRLTSSVSSIDTTLTGWATVIPAGSQIRFNLNSNDIVTRFTIQLVCLPAAG